MENLNYRPIDIRKDRMVLLEIHCLINYASETPTARKLPYEEYRQKWMNTPQPDAFISDLEETMKDERTIAELMEGEGGSTVGYLWVKFEDIEGYDRTVAYVMDIAVVADYRKRGIGSEMMEHIEKLARERGANILRSDTGIDNKASQKLHEKMGFRKYHILYEKVLDEETEKA